MKMIKHIWRKGFRINLLITLIAFSTLISSNSYGAGSSTIDDVIVSHLDGSTIQITLRGYGILKAETMFYDNPPRLVFDFNSTILRYNKGQTKKIQLASGNLNSMAIAQFQNNPDIVRVVLYFNKGDADTLLKNMEVENVGGKIVITYPAKGRVSNNEQSKPPKNKFKDEKKIINRLMHKRTSTESDCFVLISSKSISVSSSKFEPDKLILNFDNCKFDIPASSSDKNRLDAPINGGIIDQLSMINKPDYAVLEMRIKKYGSETPMVELNLSYPNEGELQIDVIKADSDAMLNVQPMDWKKLKDSSHGNITEIIGGEPALDKEEVQKQYVRIKRLKIAPIESGDRFIFEVTGGALKPFFEKFDNPPVLSMKIFNSSIATPDKNKTEYNVQVDGETTRELKVSNKKYGEVPETTILFYLKVLDINKIKSDFYPTSEPNVYHLDIAFKSAIEEEQSATKDSTKRKNKESFSRAESSFGLESGSQEFKQESNNKTIETNREVEPSTVPDDDSNRVVEVPRIEPKKVAGEKTDLKRTESPKVDKTISDSKKIDPFTIPKDDDSSEPGLTSPLEGKTDKKLSDKGDSIKDFSVESVFMPSSGAWDKNNYPLMMFIVFNKEKGSFVIYVIYSSEGKLRFARFP